MFSFCSVFVVTVTTCSVSRTGLSMCLPSIEFINLLTDKALKRLVTQSCDVTVWFGTWSLLLSWFPGNRRRFGHDEDTVERCHCRGSFLRHFWRLQIRNSGLKLFANDVLYIHSQLCNHQSCNCGYLPMNFSAVTLSWWWQWRRPYQWHDW